MDLSKRVIPIAWKVRWLIIALSILSLVLIKENATKSEIFIPLVIITFYNIIVKFLYKKIIPFRISYFESALDTLFVSSLVASTGGIKSPFYLFYFLSLIFATCYYSRGGAIILSLGVSIIYFIIILIQKEALSSFGILLIRIPLFFVIAGMGSVLVSETKLCEAELEDERERAKLLQPQLQSTMYELGIEEKRLSQLYNISLKMDMETPLKKRLDYIISEIMNFVKTDINLIFLLNPETGKLELATSSGKPGIAIPPFKMGEGFVGKALKEGKTIVVQDIHFKDEPDYNFLKELKIASFISVCLGSSDAPLGLIICGSYAKRRFSEKDKVFIELIGNILSLHLKNEKLYEEINRLSITDNDTALFAYLYFENKLKEEFERSMRILRSLSLIIIKLELPPGFSEVQRIGLIINSQTRASDCTSYNDGRFYILALRTGRDKIGILANRIKKEIEEKTGYFPVIGIACYPSSITNYIDLLRSANSALAEAFKHRDRLVISNE